MQTTTNDLGFSGRLGARVLRAPGPGLAYQLRNLPNVLPGLMRHSIARVLKMNHMLGKLQARLIRADGTVVNYGIVSTNLVTTAFVVFLVDQLQTETSEIGDFKYHDSGVGTTAAAVGDTDIETTDAESRVTGTQIEGASTNIYKSVGTIAYTTTLAITEHGLFSQATGTTLMDRHVFAAINVVNGDSIEFSYELTCTAGG